MEVLAADADAREPGVCVGERLEGLSQGLFFLLVAPAVPGPQLGPDLAVGGDGCGDRFEKAPAVAGAEDLEDELGKAERGDGGGEGFELVLPLVGELAAVVGLW